MRFSHLSARSTPARINADPTPGLPLVVHAHPIVPRAAAAAYSESMQPELPTTRPSATATGCGVVAGLGDRCANERGRIRQLQCAANAFGNCRFRGWPQSRPLGPADVKAFYSHDLTSSHA